jgi:hypothetical protein
MRSGRNERMERLAIPLQRFVNGFFVSTADTFDMGLETMVFPAEADARIEQGIFFNYVKGVDFGNPVDKFTRHYKTVEEAKQGHKDTIQELLKEKGGAE